MNVYWDAGHRNNGCGCVRRLWGCHLVMVIGNLNTSFDPSRGQLKEMSLKKNSEFTFITVAHMECLG